MRRKDRAISDRAEIDAVLAAEPVMHLALAQDNVPFVVPVYFAYDGHAVYFHSADAGSKIAILKANNRVCFEVTTGHGVIEAEQACGFAAKHRTVIGVGKAVFIDDPAEKRRVLDLIIARFTERTFDLPEAAVAKTAVVRIDVDSIKGKKNGY